MRALEAVLTHHRRYTMNFDTSVASDLYQAGYGDDGHPYIAELYYVVIQYQDGRTFRHQSSFAGAKRQVDEEDGVVYFEDVRASALTEAECLAERVRSKGAVDLQHWDEIDPAYGSEAYVSQGTEAKRVLAERLAG
jgi:hypothetical protein